MIVAAVLLALVASSQVQAFPGSDPIAEIMSTVPEHHLRPFGNPDIFCLVGYVQKVKTMISEATVEMDSCNNALHEAYSRISACMDGEDDKMVCVSQAIRDTWEGNAKLRADVYKLVEKATDLYQQIKTKCFKSSALRVRPLAAL